MKPDTLLDLAAMSGKSPDSADNVRTSLDGAVIRSAYMDGDGSLYLYGETGRLLEGWPEGWPETVSLPFLEARGIEWVNGPTPLTPTAQILERARAIFSAPPGERLALAESGLAPFLNTKLGEPFTGKGQFGEPWAYSSGWDSIVKSDGKAILYDAYHFPEPYQSRAVECVNACAGMERPKWEITGLKDFPIEIERAAFRAVNNGE